MAAVATEFRLFRFGENPTEKGTFILTRQDAESCVRAFRARGTDLAFDYEHDVTKDAKGPVPASGWGKLEVRADGLWAVGVEWTATARKLLEAREYRYFSPFFEHTEDGHITNIINVALTNIPATHGISAIATSALGRQRRVVRGAAQQIPGGRSPATRARALTRTSMDKEEMAKRLAALEEECAKLRAQLAEGDKSDETNASADGEGDEKKKDDEAASAAAALCALTGETSPIKALAKLTSQLGVSTESERDALIEGAIREGRLQPALKTWAKATSLESLRAFLSAAKPMVRTAASAATPDQQPASSGQLTATEITMCSRMGIDPAKFAAQKARLAGKGI